MNDFNELKHHGIKGMKWGVRRFQNPDGTLTSSGKARYNTNLKQKDSRDMSDEDLQKSNRRLSQEAEYNRLSGRPYRNKTSTTDKFIKAGASSVGSFLAVSGAISLNKLFKDGSVNKSDLKDTIVPGLIAAFGASVGSLTTSYGGQVNRSR